MRVLSLEPDCLREIEYRNVAGKGCVVSARLPVHVGWVSRLPEPLEGLLMASDLQGLEAPPAAGEPRLLGHLVAEAMAALADSGAIPPRSRVGVILAGDLHALPHRRGGNGDVRSVWLAFRDHFRWVAGVPGNHDAFGQTPAEFTEFCRTPGLFYLDGQARHADGLKLAGLGGIIGRPGKPFRKTQEQFLFSLETLLAGRPDVLVLHEAPALPALGLAGVEIVGACLEAYPPTLVVCGHKHWPQPLAALGHGGQVLNVDARVVLLKPRPP